MPINLAPLRDSLFTQIIIALAILVVVLILLALAGQNMARVFTLAFVGVAIVALIYAFKNIDDLGEWLSKTVFKVGFISTPDVSTVVHTITQFLT
ncbi:TPA: hypothetical protein IQC28_002778 [Listeria monocytogenes]|uniref:hypothetical protein n=1 Tax=Listeria monocytogenes TaxID=1639 RepID=UPI000775A403|nr:hypothetical protein [Listeria monocytogenes]EHC5259596.1 hypothetical protein [Listeria monocytogenes serotype 1/2a]EAD8889236.1 hypothetical protein [Listeria monocytogenes]EAF4462046.1 hypothetical protein [Listeria monocytogenes]EAG5668199.1 hypothetical protein [Listeria monocytogenes]EDO1218668.1 hypothetical protein [Listeria monocytogenes]